MAQEPLRSLIRHLRQLTDLSEEGTLSDAQLVERFALRRDGAAFEVLLWRHGPMVLEVCRRLLRHEQDAEDAFQATFLALVRKAASIRRPAAVASWLYKVAYRVAVAARAGIRRAERELTEGDLAEPGGADDVVWRDLRPILDEEVSRLPEKYRTPFVLCCLQGRTSEEAARQLGWARGTLLSRLARARQRLRFRLTRRGVSLSAGLLAALVAEKGLAATVPAGLVELTLKAALAVAAGTAATAVVSAQVAALTEGVLRAMFLTKVKTTLTVLMAVGVAVAGVGVAGNWLLAGGQPPRRAQAEEPRGLAAGEGGEGPKAEPEDPVMAAARRMQSQRNLKKIAVALHNYHDAMGSFPPPAIYGKNGKALLSWRVAILPYLEQDHLYRRFKLDEPWDSAHNRRLLAEMPAVYAPPGVGPREPYATYYQAIVGSGTGFERPQWGGPFGGGSDVGGPGAMGPIGGEGGAAEGGSAGPGGGPPGGTAPPGGRPPPPGMVGGGAMGPGVAGAGGMGMPGMGFVSGPRGLRYADFTDGTSNTLLVVEAATPVPWTKPEDLPYVPDQALPKLGGLFGGDFHALFADGAVYLLGKRADEETLRAAITRNGGEVTDIANLRRGALGTRGTTGKVTAQGVAQENTRLREVLEATIAETEKLKEDLDLLKVRLAQGLPSIDPKTAQLLKQNEELQHKLDKALGDLDSLKAEKARLERELEKRFKGKE